MKHTALEKSALVKFLGDVIKAEVSKPDGQADMELIEECDGFLSDLLDERFSLTEEEIERRLSQVRTRSNKRKVKNGMGILRRHTKQIIACACVVIFVCTGIISSYAYFPSFHDWVNKTLNLPVGESLDVDGITFINIGDSTVYPDIETLMEKEGLGEVLYPKNLPDDLQITSVTYHGAGTEFPFIIFKFSDPSLHFSINFNYSWADNSTNSDYTETVGNVTFVIRQLDNIFHAAAIDDEGRLYIIEAPLLDNVKKVIQGLDGGAK